MEMGWLYTDDTTTSTGTGNGCNQTNPALLMVYGHGQRVDSAGEFKKCANKIPEVGLKGSTIRICQSSSTSRQLLLNGGLNTSTSIHLILTFG